MPPKLNPTRDELPNLSIEQLRRLLLRVRRNNDGYHCSESEILQEKIFRSSKDPDTLSEPSSSSSEHLSESESNFESAEVQSPSSTTYHSFIYVDGAWFYPKRALPSALSVPSTDVQEIKIPDHARCPPFPQDRSLQSIESWISNVMNRYQLTEFIFRGAFRNHHIRLWLGQASTSCSTFSNALSNCNVGGGFDAFTSAIAQSFGSSEGNRGSVIRSRFITLKLPKKGESLLNYWQETISVISDRNRCSDNVVSDQELIAYILKLINSSLYLDLDVRQVMKATLKVKTTYGTKMIYPLVPGARCTLEHLCMAVSVGLLNFTSFQGEPLCTRTQESLSKDPPSKIDASKGQSGPEIAPLKRRLESNDYFKRSAAKNAKIDEKH